MLIARITLGLCILIGSGSFSAFAEGLRLPQTRVIFDATEKSALAGIDNLGDNTYLVKAQVVTEMNNPGASPAPFVVTPPLFRLEPQGRYTVRIVPQGISTLPIDRESVSYLSFLAIPSTPPPTEVLEDEALSAQVSIGVQTIIKVFYRPAKLPMTVLEAERLLTVSVRSGEVMMLNPTPYFLTLDSLDVNGQPVPLDAAGPMITPYSHKTFAVSGSASGPVRYSVINDFGGISEVFTAKATGSVALAGPATTSAASFEVK